MAGEKVNLDEVERLVKEYLITLPTNDGDEWYISYNGLANAVFYGFSDNSIDGDGQYPSFIEWLKRKTAS